MRKVFVIAVILNILLASLALAAVTTTENTTVIGVLVSITPEQTVPADTSKSSTGSKSSSSTAASSKKNTAAATTQTPASVVINSQEKLYRFEVPPQATFLIDGLSVKLSDFRPGLEVKAKVDGLKVVSMESYSNVQPGYVDPSQKTQIGTVTGFDSSLDEMRVKINGKQVSFPMTPNVIVTRNGLNISQSELFVGDHVKLFYDEYDDIYRIEVEGSSILVKELIKGELRYCDTISSKLTLEDVKAYKNGEWTDYSSYLQLPLDDKVPVYMGAQAIPAKNLKYYSGKEAYAVLGTSLGRDCIKKMVFKSNYERIYSSTIYEVNWSRDSFNLLNLDNIAMNEGTIIIQNNRLIDASALDKRCQAAVIAEATSGRTTADVISVLGSGLNNSPLGDYYLYEGHINEIGTDTIELAGVHNLDKNEWSSGGENDFYYSTETIIYDITGQQFITRKQFFSGDYDHYYGYFYTDGNNIIAMTLQKHSIDADDDNTSYGTIASTSKSDTMGWVMTLTNMCEWSKEDSCWRERDSDAEVNLTTALILKHNKAISASALAADDRVFVVRTGYRARIVVVK